MKKWFVNLKISKKLSVGFLLVIALGIVIGAVGILNILSLEKNERYLYDKNTMGAISIGNARMDFQTIQATVRDIALHFFEDKTEFYNTIDSNIADIDKQLQNYGKSLNDKQDKDNFDQAKATLTDYRDQLSKFVQASKTTKTSAEAVGLINQITPYGTKLNDSLKKVVDYNSTCAQRNIGKDQTSAMISIYAMIGIVVVSVLIAVLIGSYISRLIGKPLNKVSEDAERLALGDIDIARNSLADRKDEIGRLENAIEKVISGWKKQVEETNRLATGDLTVDVQIKSEKDVLSVSINELVENLNDLVLSITNSADQVASGANLVSNSSMALSQGASEQASSVQELTASLEEIASKTKQNAQNAQRANELAQSAKSGAETGNTQMREMLRAMDEISTASSSINKIIKVIDDIAFQTNILALNAAVEAARAGQHGKGFAVVAEEVRTLAARSARAARETTELIESSIRKVESGTKIANTTAEALGKIVTEVTGAADLTDTIAFASNAQTVAVDQINKGILQVSQVVQNNAATSQESAAASEELSSQAARLKETVRAFKIKRQHEQDDVWQIMGAAPDVHRNPATDLSETGASKVRIALGDGEFGKY